MYDRFIQTKNLYPIIEIEPYIILGITLVINWLFYRFFLQNVSDERHRNLRIHFGFLVRHFFILSFLFGSFVALSTIFIKEPYVSVILPYLGILNLAWGIMFFVRSSRLAVLQYLFLQSAKAGVPLLLVNIFSLLLTITLSFWAFSLVFGVELTPLLATSAAVSIILGLALQDTLGNLIAGISLQLDQSFEIGDWLEVLQGTQKTVGQVKEISWRSTLLIGLSDEKITLPNRLMAQTQISNFTLGDQPLIRSQLFRLPFDVDFEKAKEVLERSVQEISEVRGIPSPLAFVSEVSDSWLTVKVVYFLDNYGAQFLVGDKVLRKGIEALRNSGINLAHQKIEYLEVRP